MAHLAQPAPTCGWLTWCPVCWLTFVLGLGWPSTSIQAAPADITYARVLELEGRAESLAPGANAWSTASTNQTLLPQARFRTLENSRAVVRMSDLSLLRLSELTHIQIPDAPDPRRGVRLWRGLLYFFHRDRAKEFPVRTPSAYAVTLGTEFTVAVAEDDATRLDVIDGTVELTNELGRLTLTSGEAGLVEQGQPPVKVPLIMAPNAIQWALYYPGVLDPSELGLTAGEEEVLSQSLAAYRSGDLLAALAWYPVGRQPVSESEKVYAAALLLAVGKVASAERLLDSLSAAGGRGASRVSGLAAALHTLIATVNLETRPPRGPLEFSSALLAESYFEQSGGDLVQALVLARSAVNQSPRFGFGWARVAELEFSFGRTAAAWEAVEKSLLLAPRNAQAVALEGFVLAAGNRFEEAQAAFDRALALNGALGNAWLGRGLCRIRFGEMEAGRADLLTAVAVEPQRAVLRSYLGKAFVHTGRDERARQELVLARQMDPGDPTGWLYAALLNQQQSRINEAIEELEHSQDLNDNRRVYRSRLLLDQDRAVRSANLAAIYEDAGLIEVSVREALRSVNIDYANYSAHLFLANSYNAIRDPRQINLRFETPWLSEYLVANLMAPVAAGTLSPYITQQEYARFFERDRIGLSSSTEYLSRGEWLQMASQYGIFGSVSYAAAVVYRSESGHRPNADLEQLTVSFQLKQELTPRDSFYISTTFFNAESGDVAPYHDQTRSNPGLRMNETQEPLLLVGYHHEWVPGVHTLLLGGQLRDTFRVVNPQQSTLLVGRATNGVISSVQPISIEQKYRSDAEIYTAELQQIWRGSDHTFILGGRYQTGGFNTKNQHTNATFFFPFLFNNQPENVSPDFARGTVYGYWQWEVSPSLQMVAGLTYDHLRMPVNFRYAPLSSEVETREKVSPKGGLIWAPTATTTVRAGYAQALGGVSFDQSFQLEPTQVAGFNQAFRSLIPESVVGANGGPEFVSGGLSLEQKLGHGTYVALSGDWLESEVLRSVGVYDAIQTPFVPSETRQHFDYRERNLLFTLHQLIREHWSLGVRYRLSQAELQEDFVDLPGAAPPPVGFQPQSELEAILHQVRFTARFYHPSGIFGQAETLWNRQTNHGYSPALAGEDFWQFNLWAGWRFLRRHGELSVGLLNLTDQDYRLNPLNLTADLPRERTLALKLRFYY